MVKKIKKRTKKQKATSLKLQANLEFSKAELEEAQLIFEECLSKFNEHFYKDYNKKETQEKPKDDLRVPNGQEQEPKDRERDDVDLPDDEDIRKIFKKIALVTHPDKLRDSDPEEALELTELYKDAAEAASLGDGGELILIAAKLRIRLDIDFEKEVQWASEKIGKLTEKTTNLTRTDAWLWFHSEGPQREKIEKFIKERMSS